MRKQQPNTEKKYDNTVPTLKEFNAELVQKSKSWHKLDICPACQKTSLARFPTVRHMPYSCCRSCGFTFANPVPSEQTINTFYNSSFYCNYRAIEENQIALGKRFSISIATETMRDLASWLENDKSLNILDYGCGPGTFASILRDEFNCVNVEALEMNQKSIVIADYHYNLKVVSSPNELQHKLYDCVTLLEVLEHIPEPDIFFQQISNMIKPGGCILIATPAVDNLIGMFLPEYADAPYTAPCHISLFTKESLTCLLSRFGFNIERMQVAESWGVIEKIFASILYELDFLSPQHDDDFNDLLYTPNKLGRLLSLKPCRSLPSNLLFRVLRQADILLAHIARHIPGIPMNGHIYVLARKCL